MYQPVATRISCAQYSATNRARSWPGMGILVFAQTTNWHLLKANLPLGQLANALFNNFIFNSNLILI